MTADNCFQIHAPPPLRHTLDTIKAKPLRYAFLSHLIACIADQVADGKQKWQVYVDPYTKLTRLDLYKFDGSPMNPMFLAYSPPQMLPTVTMNPTSTAAASASATAKAKSKRSLEDLLTFPLNKDAKHIKRDGGVPETLLQRIDLNVIWWTGIGMTIFGGAAYLL